MTHCIPKKLFLLCLLTFIGCGFHLRGNIDLPANVKNILLDIQGRDNILEQRLEYLLKLKHIKVYNTSPENINLYTLRIHSHSFNEQVLAYSQSNLPERIRIIISIPIEIINMEGKVIIATTATTSSQISITPNNPVIQNQEKNIAKDDLRKKAANQIINIFAKSMNKKNIKGNKGN
ncbi:MAG: hypothetical protein HOI53_09575, partial [Francisellaceae bacterium]|nr:hypothetical protein [Francisellaceae bacterium]